MYEKIDTSAWDELVTKWYPINLYPIMVGALISELDGNQEKFDRAVKTIESIVEGKNLTA